MNKLGTVTLLSTLVLGLALTTLMAETSTRPPQDLKKVGDHWTPWDPPEAGPDAYIIQKVRCKMISGRNA